MVEAVSMIEKSCPAKVNLALSVGATPPDRDDGMHPIASWMVALNFGDLLKVRKASQISSFDIRFADDAPVAAKVDWPLSSDLVYRAHQLVEEHAGRKLPVDVELIKRVPPGSGLGGGSSDAASMLLALSEMFALNLSREQLMEMSAKLGSDVSFFIAAGLGDKSNYVAGTGHDIQPLPLDDVIHLVLIFPPFGCPTGPVYRAFDELNDSGKQAEPDRVRALAAQSPLLQDAPFNDLAAPACKVVDELGSLIKRLEQSLSLPVHVSGSGSTLFIVAPSMLTVKALARKVSSLTGLPAIAARTL